MCRGCQYCFESCYWHLVEKHFCYDESIALYEEPLKMTKHSNSFENMAFYDQVSLIAGRAIVTIDPLPNKPKPIEHQPARRVRWWEDNVDEQNKENEAKNKNKRRPSPIPTIMEASKEDLSSSMEELDSIIREKVSITITDSKKEETTTTSPNLEPNKTEDQKLETKSEEDKAVDATTTVTGPRKSSSVLLTVTEQLRNRKKSLRERRMSRSLTLNIDRHLELPIIRQISMPKFYIDTPEANQIDNSILMAPSTALTSPVMPRSSQNDFFDLRSVVQLEIEQRASGHHNPVPVHKQLSPHSRLSQIKEKLKATKLKRQGSATNLPNSIQHI